MSKKAESKYKRYYINIFLSLTTTVFLTILALSTVLYKSFEKIALDQNYSLVSDNLMQVKQAADFMNATARNISVQIYYDQNVMKLLYFDSLNDIEMNSSLKQLDYYRNVTPLVNSIYLYNARTETFYVSSDKINNGVQQSEEFYDKDFMEHLKEYRQFVPYARRVGNERYGENSGILNVYSLVYLGFDREPRISDNVIVVNISGEWINKITDGLNSKLESNTFILDNKNRVISGTYRFSMLQCLSKEKFVEAISQSETPNGWCIEKVDNEQCLVSYIRTASPGWTYVRITPYSVIVDKIRDLRNRMLLIGVLIFLLGLLASFLESHKLYIPINDVLARLKKLESENSDTFYTIKNEFLRNIMMEPREHNLSNIQEKFTKFTIRLDAGRQMLFILLKIDRYKEFCNKYKYEDRSLFKFAIANITMEVFAGKYKCEAVDMGDDNIVLLLNSDSSETDMNYLGIEYMIKEIQSNVASYINLSLSAVISLPSENINSINNMFNNVLEVSCYRMFYGHGCILSAREINKFKLNNYEYPMQMEKLIVEKLILGKKEEVKAMYLEVISGIRECPYTTFNFVLSRLAFTIDMAINTLQKNKSCILKSPMDVNIIRIFSNQSETIEEINEQVFKVLDEITDRIGDRRIVSQDYLVDKVMGIIEREYANSNLSVEYIADLLEMSPTYVSRMFKMLTQKSITDRIAEERMEKARSLLTDTGDTIEKIAEKTGYASSVYFHKSFKKYNGITPGEYRVQNRIQGQVH